MKFPKEDDGTDNELATILNSVHFLRNLTVNEMGILLQMFFSNLFQFILALSKLIDVNPREDTKLKYKRFQKKAFNAQLLCELISPMRVLNAVEPVP